ncbi:Asp-tRNA(Asn)/Glu-tRNA(Gln) amidotransferase subunit GatA [Patescibacteria group bacterium]|nr:Asp-tRNA(Asn)/Glu-tRNA(Gln) amidotransferase subunit GatA [Patescibacteria group bacterium]MBU1931580.1 Asp-tRNA(Asn)/Glu-tRNA(Gln) amidotransferase subunit GatA [Patescibacteria group bacterium]
MKLNELTIVAALEGLKKRRFSAVELTQACLDQIKRVDPKVKAFITVCEAEALAAAKKADLELKQSSTKPLLGIPVAIKDNFCTRGVKTTASSKVLENYIPVYDATVVAKLKQAGVVILGKTNMDAWAHGSSTETSDFFTTLNPWDIKRLPGGSSGGSAAAVVADQTIFAIGSETAGSIRQPAAWCGVVGLKPTYGRVSRYGVIAMASSTDSPGPICKTATDAALVLQVLAGQDPLDATTSPNQVSDYSKLNLPKKLKIGIPKEYFLSGMSKAVVTVVKQAIESLKKAGAEIKIVSLLDPKYSVAVYTIIQRSEVSSNLARYDGIRYGNSRQSFGNEAKNRMMLGVYTLSSGYYDQYYNKAQKVRTLICQDFDRVFKQVDLLLAPTSPTPALLLGASAKSPMFGELQDILVEASSMAGLPGINLPCGFSKTGLPIGMQLIGPQFSEALLLQVGHQYQQLTDWHQRKPKIVISN